MGAEEVGEFVRALCPEAFAEQRKLASNVAGERRTPPPAARSGSGSSGTGLYGAAWRRSGVGRGLPGHGAADARRRARDGGTPGASNRSWRGDPRARSCRALPAGARVRAGWPGAMKRWTRPRWAPPRCTGCRTRRRWRRWKASGQALEKPERRRPLAQIAVAALLLVGATVGLTTYVIHTNTASPAVVPPAPVTPTEPVVAAPEPPVVTAARVTPPT